MLSEEQIREALHASRAMPIGAINAHGPLGLEHLAAAVAKIKADLCVEEEARVRRPIDLPVETWEKLDHLASAAARATSSRVSAGDLAAAIIEQYVAATET